jgi:Fur family transcriptional regulator, ferric uptake regulator
MATDANMRPASDSAPPAFDAAAMLRGVGQRVTPQRLAVLGAFADRGGHLTADEVFQRIDRSLPGMTLSTVYRTLELLRDLHIVSETDLGGGMRQYELVTETPHHHLVCSRCGGMTELDDAALEPLRAHARRVHGFEPVVHHLALFGLCAACQQAGEQAGS